jgi:hypothetical protein
MWSWTYFRLTVINFSWTWEYIELIVTVPWPDPERTLSWSLAYRDLSVTLSRAYRDRNCVDRERTLSWSLAYLKLIVTYLELIVSVPWDDHDLPWATCFQKEFLEPDEKDRSNITWWVATKVRNLVHRNSNVDTLHKLLSDYEFILTHLSNTCLCFSPIYCSPPRLANQQNSTDLIVSAPWMDEDLKSYSYV